MQATPRIWLAGGLTIAVLALASVGETRAAVPEPLLDWSAWEQFGNTVKHPCATLKPADLARARANIER